MTKWEGYYMASWVTRTAPKGEGVWTGLTHLLHPAETRAQIVARLTKAGWEFVRVLDQDNYIIAGWYQGRQRV